MLLVGVDAGATRCRALAAQNSGDVVGRGISGPANPHNVGPKVAAKEIARAVRQATGNRAAGIVVAGVAGIEVPRLRKNLQIALRAARITDRLHLYSDAAIALDGAFLSGPGVVVIAGTGSVAWGRDAQGREAHAGGWGHLLDDAGSGYDIGRRGLAAVLRAHDHRGPTTALTPRLLAALRIQHPEEMGGVVRGMAPFDIAALAPKVLETAAEGDPVATRIVHAAADELAQAASAVWDWLSLPPRSSVAGIGGVFEHPIMRRAFAGALSRERADALVIPPRLPPAGGALWRAFVLSGRTPDGPITARLQTGVEGYAAASNRVGKKRV